MKEIYSIITHNAFDSEFSFEKESKYIFLDLTENSKELINENLRTSRIFKPRLFQSISSVPSTIHKSWEYIYTIEVDNGKFLKIGYSKDIKKRLLTHQNDVKSPLKDKCGRITLIGPLRDGLNTEQYIHTFMGGFYASEDFPASVEIYSLENVKITLRRKFGFIISDKDNIDNIFELFNGITINSKLNSLNESGGFFGLIQYLYYMESLRSCLYPQDLIIPKVKY